MPDGKRLLRSLSGSPQGKLAGEHERNNTFAESPFYVAAAEQASASVAGPVHRKMSPQLQLLDWQDKADGFRIKQIKAWAAPDGHIVWTLANYSWLDFVLNWIAAVDLAGIDHFFIATLDDQCVIPENTLYLSEPYVRGKHV